MITKKSKEWREFRKIMGLKYFTGWKFDMRCQRIAKVLLRFDIIFFFSILPIVGLYLYCNHNIRLDDQASYWFYSSIFQGLGVFIGAVLMYIFYRIQFIKVKIDRIDDEIESLYQDIVDDFGRKWSIPPDSSDPFYTDLKKEKERYEKETKFILNKIKYPFLLICGLILIAILLLPFSISLHNNPLWEIILMLYIISLIAIGTITLIGSIYGSLT